MHEVIEISELRKTRREQERERRRMRDRQRRLSMTNEQRQRHLARRRRNYQLRRLRAAQNAEISTNCPSKHYSGNSHQFVDFGHGGQETMNPTSIRSLGLEALMHESDNLQRRVRLSHIRRVARSTNNAVSEPKTEKEITTGDTIDNCLRIGDCDLNRSSPKALRLNHVKHLARSIKSAEKDFTAFSKASI